MILLVLAFFAVPYFAKALIAIYLAGLVRDSWRALRSRGP